MIIPHNVAQTAGSLGELQAGQTELRVSYTRTDADNQTFSLGQNQSGYSSGTLIDTDTQDWAKLAEPAFARDWDN